MDPVLLPAVSKLMALGISLWNAHDKHGVEELDAIKSILDATDGLSKLGPDKTPIGARHFFLVVSAFGEALKRHWYGDEHYAPGTGLWARLKGDSLARDRVRQIEERMRIAAPRLVTVGDRRAADDLTVVSSLVGDPVSTPYYQQLWSAFAEKLRADEEPLIMPDGKLQFEKHFRLAYAEGLASPRGEQIRQHLMTLDEQRTELVRELLIRDLAGWGHRHAFWSVEEQEGLPHMPLGGMYVEPLGAMCAEPRAEGRRRAPEPVLGLIERLIEEHPVTVVRADFGQGKSLTARTLAWRKAVAYLGGSSPSPELWRPLFVKCAEDFQSHRDDLNGVLRRALWRHAQGLRLDLPSSDTVFDPAELRGRTLVLVDGLDEVVLSDSEVGALLRQVVEQASATRHFVLFTRPAALGRAERLKDIPILDLLPFTTRNGDGEAGGQVEEWLARWRRCARRPLTPMARDLEERDLLSVAKTPILLFMIADSWHTVATSRPSLGGIYEGFFRNIARGKHEKDKDQNKPIAEASQRLRDRLVDLEWLPHDAGPPEAMLWLMSRVAWKMKCLEDAAWLDGRPESFDPWHARIIVRDELSLDKDETIARTIHLGLLLALQANLEEGSTRLLFGHKSFRDFLVARYWASRLRMLLRDEERRWEFSPKEPLLCGRLLGDDQTFRFLRDCLAGWPAAERARLARWAQRCFDDERFMDGAREIRSDRRALLREAAPAIAAALRAPGLVVEDERKLLSLLAWFWMQQLDVIVHAPGLRARGALLGQADLRGAYLLGADLTGAHLSAADLGGAVLCRASLREAALHEARLSGADLRRADLRGAKLRMADLRGADLRGARLGGADLCEARLRGANLRRADLRGADLAGADYDDRQLAESKRA